MCIFLILLYVASTQSFKKTDTQRLFGLCKWRYRQVLLSVGAGHICLKKTPAKSCDLWQGKDQQTKRQTLQQETRRYNKITVYRVSLITAFRYLKEDCRQDGDWLFSASVGNRIGAMTSNWTRANLGWRLGELSNWGVAKHWNVLPRGVVESLSSVLLGWFSQAWPCLEQAAGPDDLMRSLVPLLSYDCMILYSASKDGWTQVWVYERGCYISTQMIKAM